MKCPYCDKEAVLKDSEVIYGKSYGMVWICVDYPKCDAYVGVHKNSEKHAPLGRMANRELRELKKEAHALFDTLWKSRQLRRSEAYEELRTYMDMTKYQCHIGKFNESQCRKAIKVVGGILRRIASERNTKIGSGDTDKEASAHGKETLCHSGKDSNRSVMREKSYPRDFTELLRGG